MDWPEVAKRIAGGEDARTEFKQALGDLSGIGRALCAFANSDGGLIVLGVGDDGEVVGIPSDPGAVHERLTSFLHTGCSEPILARHGCHQHGGKWVHWLLVPRLRGFNAIQYKDRYWIRRERSSVPPSSTELQDMLNGLRFRLAEEQVVPSADLAHLDISAFEKFLDARDFRNDDRRQPASETDLRNFGVIREYDGKYYPTLYGILRFGRTPQIHPHMTSFLVRCAAYEGDDRGTGVILAGEADGRLDEQVHRALGWFRSLGWREKYEGAVRENIPRLPPEALREALVNAVAHRDYAATGSAVMLDVFSDRAEITSPGTLPNHMTVEAVKAGGGPRSRNEMLANFLVEAGLMEKRGHGWFIMRNAMRDFNGTEPELINSTEANLVRVTLRFAPPDERKEA